MSQIVNGTTYHDKTPMEVIKILEYNRQHYRVNRLRLSFGDAKTGRDWLEEGDVEGYVGRSTGTTKVPLLIANSRSMGGGAILDHCIVRIKTTAGGTVLWQHPKYNRPTFTIHDIKEKVKYAPFGTLTVMIKADGERHAAFRTMAEARRWLHKMS
jgi:hypothetical protein